MTHVELSRPWLVFDLSEQMQVLSWAINKPGFVKARKIIWREVRNADLPRDMDVHGWFARELTEQGHDDAVAFLTSRDVTFYTQQRSTVGTTTAHCVATVGLSNAERIGTRLDRSAQDWGTINVAVRLDQPVSQTALLEMMSIATQARTAAIIDAGWRLPTGIATGTGTDCIAIAAPEGTTDYAGLHTEIGEAVGDAVYRSVAQGAREWTLSVAPKLFPQT